MRTRPISRGGPAARPVSAGTPLLWAVLGLASLSGPCAAQTGPGALGIEDAWLAQTEPDLPSLGAEPTDREDERRARRSYVIPALDIVAFDSLLNLVNRLTIGGDYDSNLSSIQDNLQHEWVTDDDPYRTNQVLHPYQGSMYHGFARSAGLNYWESALYTFAGSTFWEIAGENTPPSKNDQVASGIAGSFLGEPLYRMANLLLEQADGIPSFWRELTAAAISPSTGFNRLAYGDRFDTLFDSHDPAYYGRLQLGSSATAQNRLGPATKLERAEVIADYSMDYGLPGKPGYTYKRPFDHFSFHITGSTGNGVESMTSRGLLFGTDYAAGDSLRGVWGLYGSYDYIAPQLFRVSSTALSVGTTVQEKLSDDWALQGSAALGAGYAAAGTLHPTGDSDYHYGVAPQALASFRVIYSDRAALDFNAREYFVSSAAAANRSGHDNIARADISFIVRIKGHHAIALKYIWSRRDASIGGLSDFTQERGTVGLFYTWLAKGDLGMVHY